MDQALRELCYRRIVSNQQGIDTIGNLKHKRDLGQGVGLHPIPCPVLSFLLLNSTWAEKA